MFSVDRERFNYQKDIRNDHQLVFNVTYPPNISNMKDTMLGVNNLPIPYYLKVAIIDFWKVINLRHFCRSQSSSSEENWR